jgi:phosphotransferase system HPr (HPr) family protein
VLVAKAREFASEVRLASVPAPGQPPTVVDAKNLLDILFLGAPASAELDLEATGPDAAEATAALARLFEIRFGTEGPGGE